MSAWKQGTFLASLLLVVGFFTTFASCEQPRRRPRDRVIAAQDDIPITSFSCANKTQGYYADVETGCQVYHMCDGGRQFSYRCPDTTLFQQRMLICAHWYQVNCSRSEQHYSANLLIGQRDKPFVDEADYIHIYYNGKEIKTLTNPDELQNLNGNNGLTQNNQLLHNKRVAAHVPVPNAHEKIINTHITPTQSVFISTNPSFNPQFSNQNFKTHAATTQAVFNDANFNTNFEFSKQNFKTNVEPTRTVFPNENSNSNFQFSNQNFHRKVETTPAVVSTTAIPNPNFPFINQNVKPFEPLNIRQPVPSFQTRTTSFTPVNKLATNPTIQPQPEEKISTHNTFSNQNTNPPIIQTNEYNNFIKRFNPDSITEAIIKDNRNDDSFLQYNNFIKRFNPEEESLGNVNKANDSIASFVDSNVFGNRNFESHNLEPPVEPPSSFIELPLGDAVHMESNNLELRFQDPRQAFFIPESDSQIIPAESVTPITVHIPRNAGQQFHPMLFVNSVSDSCFRCHPSFIVDKASCTPCVIIR